ncbi:MAG: ABC transporter permease [Bacteroidia bacterium]|nr:ABC transporter permease [Bacteroidia bacterium]
MLRYIARRLVVFFPTLFVILLVSFLISRNVPGDQVYSRMDAVYQRGSQIDAELRSREYLRISHEMGLDLPTFYVSLNQLAYPDTLHRIPVLSERNALSKLIGVYGNWPEISTYFHHLEAVEAKIAKLAVPEAQKMDYLSAQRAVSELKMTTADAEVKYRLDQLDSLAKVLPLLGDAVGADIADISRNYAAVLTNATTWKLYVPTVHFFGFKNQFHHWLTGLLMGDLGKSYSHDRKVSKMITEALPWTMFLGFFSFCIAYLIAIPVGVYSVRHRHQWQDNAVTIGLFLLNSVPTFVAAMLVMTFFCNQDYWQLFPTSGVASDGSELWSWPARLLDHAYHLILPTIMMSYHGIAYVSRQLRMGMVENLNADYIRTARAKGLSDRVVIWRHNFRNALLPLVTLISGLLPAMVGGAMITEYIFSVPGMGLLTLNALGSFDHPVVVGIYTLTSIATLTGFFISDILYAFVDPRISFTKR